MATVRSFLGRRLAVTALTLGGPAGSGLGAAWRARSPYARCVPWFRRNHLPPAVAAVKQRLRPGEQRLAQAAVAPGGDDADWLVATTTALWLPGRPEPHRLPWEAIAHVTWRDGVLTVTEAGPDGGPLAERAHVFALVDAKGFPDAVHDRVTASVLWSRHHRLRGRDGVRVLARRTERGTVTWSLVYDAGVDPLDPVLSTRAEALLAEARGELGA